MTQHQQILDYIYEHGSITPLDAISAFGCTKLSTRVGELKRAGYDITGEMETSQSGKRYMRYRWTPSPALERFLKKAEEKA